MAGSSDHLKESTAEGGQPDNIHGRVPGHKTGEQDFLNLPRRETGKAVQVTNV